jgi:hypothetical protein
MPMERSHHADPGVAQGDHGFRPGNMMGSKIPDPTDTKSYPKRDADQHTALGRGRANASSGKGTAAAAELPQFP